MSERQKQLWAKFQSTRNIFGFILVFLLVIAFIVASFFLVYNGMNRNVDNQAKAEISEEASSDAGRIHQVLENRFSDLENAAVYTVQLMHQEDPTAFLTTVLEGHGYCTVAVTDKEGNIKYSARTDGAVLASNVAASDYFNIAIASKDAHALSYKEKTSMSEEPRYIFAVPLVYDGEVTGILFGSMKPAVLDRELWTEGSYGNGKEVFISDANGKIINEHGEHFPLHANLYQVFGEPESARNLFDSISAGKNGDIDYVANEPGFLSFRTINKDGWFVYIFMSKNLAHEKYMSGLKGIVNIFRFLAVLFLIVFVFIFSVVFSIFLDNRRYTKGIKKNLDRVDNYISNVGGSFEYDIRSMELHCSEEVEKMLGHPLPATWFSDLEQHKNSNPDFEYDGLMEAYNKVLFNKEYTEVTVSTGRGSRTKYLTLSMGPIFDRSGRVSGVFGTVRDDTEQLSEKNDVMYENALLMRSMLDSYLCLMVCNLEENSFSDIAANDDSVIRNNSDISYDEFIAKKAESIADTAVKTVFDETFSREKLIKEYAEQDMELSLDYPTVNNGATCWQRMTVSSLREKKGNTPRVFITIKDISTEKKEEVQLQHNLDQTIRNMPGYICKWAFEGDDIILQDANQDFFRFMRTTREKAVGRSVIYGFSHEEKKTVIDEFYKAASDHSVLTYTGHAFRYDGDEMWLNVHGTYYGEENGTVIYYCILSDVTKMHLLDAENRTYKKKLEFLGTMTPVNAIEYRIADRKLKRLSGFSEDFIEIINGHSPDYVVHKGVVDTDSLPEYYKMVTAVESGIPQDEKTQYVIGFRTKDGKTQKYTCSYRTYGDYKDKPVSSVIIFKELEQHPAAAEETAVNPASDATKGRRNKLLVVNLTADSVEFESDPDDFWAVEDVSSFTKTKYQWVSAGYIHRDNAAEFCELLDTMRLRSAYEFGVREHFMEFQGSVGEGDFEPFSVKAILSRNEESKEFKAYILIYRNSDADEDEDGTQHDVSVRAFGHFDVFIDGIPVAFQNSKAKEMLAILVDRRGGYVTNSELISYLWEDESANRVTMARCRQVASRLKHTLEENGIGFILESANGKRRIIPEKIKCDYFEYMNDRVKNKALFTDAYMIDYSWSEFTLSSIKDDRNVW